MNAPSKILCRLSLRYACCDGPTFYHRPQKAQGYPDLNCHVKSRAGVKLAFAAKFGVVSNRTNNFTQRRKEQKNQRRKEASPFFAPSAFVSLRLCVKCLLVSRSYQREELAVDEVCVGAA
jgi:hypothetical protein